MARIPSDVVTGSRLRLQEIARAAERGRVADVEAALANRVSRREAELESEGAGRCGAPAVPLLFLRPLRFVFTKSVGRCRWPVLHVVRCRSWRYNVRAAGRSSGRRRGSQTKWSTNSGG